MSPAVAAASAKAQAQIGDTKDVLEAMRSIQSEGDRWELAEKLADLIPTGAVGFNVIVREASDAGVLGKLSEATLRMYRDTAVRWPAKDRVQHISFSAHREAMNLGNIKEAQKMLVDMANSSGADKVSVAKVRQAVAVKQGKVPPQRVAGNLVSAPKNAVVNLDDLRKGGKDLIAAIGVNRDSAELDELSAGLNKVLTFVERLRSKAQQKAKTSAKPAAAPVKTQQPKANGNGNGNGATNKKTPGDLRGL
jgi:hypothetical protein